MAWTTPMTAVANTGLTAAQWNASVRDNLLTTAPALATAANRWFVSDAANSIKERVITSDKILTQQTTTSTSYTDLATSGPTVTVTTGTLGMVHFGCQLFNSSTGSCWSSYDVSSATTSASTDERGVAAQGGASNGFRMGYTELQTLTSGSNVFKQQYRVSANTGTFDDRHIVVMAL